MSTPNAVVQKILESIYNDISDAGVRQITIHNFRRTEDKKTSTLDKQGWVIIVTIGAESSEDIDLIEQALSSNSRRSGNALYTKIVGVEGKRIIARVGFQA